jgi:LysR family transcriptional regulator, hca operon transcriptional activator
MDLRHLRYFVAVAEEGSFTRAAETRLHTAQPSLSRQIRDLEMTLGARLIVRGPRGLELTPAGRVFLDHARLILAQVEAGVAATRRAARPAKTPFAVGFLTGYEIEWLPKVMDALRDDLANVELTIHSAASPELIQSVRAGTLDAAFVRPDPAAFGLAFTPVSAEELFVLLPADHDLARHESLDIRTMAGENFISFPEYYAPALRRVIDDYLARAEVRIVAAREAETLPMAISLVLSTNGFTLLPAYAGRLLPPSVVARPLLGQRPLITLSVAYSQTNPSDLLRSFMAKWEPVARHAPSLGPA